MSVQNPNPTAADPTILATPQPAHSGSGPAARGVRWKSAALRFHSDSGA
jgi:hypothetical protein